ncbi:hypothetical protein OLMES_2825 [Oleiphilus messinensis]|uniref:Uncharacterized protein n=1 Tax=Oleiphilus messinensis TaxID=141451 RepID=A0A1Y0IBX0_9GAMM|nr:hypothetical protein OLMES_2825 [Oleiphilus messinensis]
MGRQLTWSIHEDSRKFIVVVITMGTAISTGTKSIIENTLDTGGIGGIKNTIGVSTVKVTAFTISAITANGGVIMMTAL